MWNLKYAANELIYKTETLTHKRKTYGGGVGDKLGVWD